MKTKNLKAETYNAEKLIPLEIQEEIINSINESTPIKGATFTRDTALNLLRNKYGWSDEITISADTKISITSKKGDIGLCLQTGNMSRFYADLLKLEYLFKKGTIHSAIYIIPEKSLAKKWGDNIANFERFTKELELFSSIVRIPILVFAIQDN